MTKKQRMIVHSRRMDLKDHYTKNRNFGLLMKFLCLVLFAFAVMTNGGAIYQYGFHLSIFNVFSILINIVMGVILFGSNSKYRTMRKPPYDKMSSETAQWDYSDYVENYCRDYKATWKNLIVVMLKLTFALLIINMINYIW